MNHKFCLCLFFSLCTSVLKVEAAQDILTSLDESIRLSKDDDVSHALKVAHSLIHDTQNSLDPHLVEKNKKTAEKILSYVKETTFNKESLLQLLQTTLNDLSPIYTKNIIGASSDEASNSTNASMFAQAKSWESQIDADVFNEVWVDLIGISQKYRTQTHSLPEMLLFYQTVGFYDSKYTFTLNSKPSLLQCLGTLSSIGTLGNKEPDNTFLSIAQNLIKTSISDKIALIRSLLGYAQNYAPQCSILGNINEIAPLAILPETPISSSFKQKLIGQNEFRQTQQDHTRSLFSHLYETSSLIDPLLALDLTTPDLNDLIQHIGIDGDKTDASLFGALSLLKDNLQKPFEENSFNQFDTSFGVSESRLPTSCLGHAFSLRKAILHLTTTNWTQNFENCLPFLYHESIQKIEPLLKNKTDSNDEEITKIILDDLVTHLKSDKESSILYQIKQLSQSIRGFSKTAYVADRIGAPNEEGVWPEFSLGAQIYRLTQDIEDSKKMDSSNPFSFFFRNNCLPLYQVFFGCSNSVQSKLYEIEAKRTHKNTSFVNLIGSILSCDNSVFGLVNQQIKKIEVDLILEKIGPKEAPAQENGTILQKLKSFHENFDKESLEQVEIVVGNDYKPHSKSNDTLINVIAYFYDVFENTFQLLPRQKLMTYARSVYQMSGELLSLENLTSNLIDEKKEDPAKALSLCGNISNKNGMTLWANVNTTLNGLYEDILGLVTKPKTINTNTHSKNLEAFVEQLSQELQEQTPPKETTPLIKKISNLKNFVDLFQKNHFQVSLVDFAYGLFGTFQSEPLLTNYDELDQQNGQDYSPLGLFETVLTTFPDVGTTFCGSPDDATDENTLYGKLNQLLYAIISKPLVSILKNDDVAEGDEKGLENLLKRVKQETKKRTKIIVEWGDDHEELSEENIEKSGIMVLFNEISRLFSKSYLTLSPTTYQKLLPILGTYYDNEENANQRSLFSTLHYIKKRLLSENLSALIFEIQGAIGLPQDKASSTHKTLYQNLNSLFYIMIPDQKHFIFCDAFKDEKSTQDSGVLKNLYELYPLLQQPFYLSLSPFQKAAQKLGNPSEPNPSGLFKKLKQKLEIFNDEQFKNLFQETRSIHSFVLFSKLLQISTFDFLKNPNSKDPIAELDFFEHALENLLSFGPCAGCEGMNRWIMEIDAFGQNALKNLKLLSPKDWISILKIDSFSPFQNQLELFDSALSTFSDQIEKEQDTGCLLFNAEQSLQEVRTGFEALAFPFQSIWVQIDKPYQAVGEILPTKKIKCASMQENLEKLGETLKGISERIIIPHAPLVISEFQSVKTLQKMSTTLTNIQNQIIKIFKKNQCSGCLVEHPKLDPIHNSMTSLIYQINSLQKFINLSYYAAFIHDLHNVSRALKKVSQHFNYNLQSDQLTDALSRGNVGSALSYFAQSFSGFPDVIAQISDLYLNEGPASASLHEHMPLCQKELKTLYNGTLSLSQVLYPQLRIHDDKEADFYQYNMEAFNHILQSLLTSLDQIYNTWESLRVASETMIVTEGEPEIIPGLQYLTQHYENMITNMTPLTKKILMESNEFLDLDQIQIFAEALVQKMKKTKQCFQSLETNFSKSCITSYAYALDDVTSKLALFARYLTALPSIDLTDQTFITYFLPEIVAILQSSADILRVSEESPKKNCPHTSLTQKCFRFSQLLTRAIRLVSSTFIDPTPELTVFEDTTPLIPGDSVDTKIQNLTIQLNKVSEWWLQFLKEPSLQFCNNQLLTNLGALGSAYGAVQTALETKNSSFVGQEICLYGSDTAISEQSWEKLIQSIQKQKDSTTGLIISLEKDIDCLKNIRTIISKISQTIHNANLSLGTHLQKITSLSELLDVENKAQSIALFDDLRKTVIAINSKVEELVLFFQHAAMNRSCIADIESCVQDIQKKLEKIEISFNQLLQIPDNNAVTIETQDLPLSVLDSCSDLQNIALTLSVFTKNLKIDNTFKDQTLPFCLFFLTQEISNTSNLLSTLFEALQNTKSEFLVCAKNLSNISLSVQQIALTTQEIGLTLQNISKKMENSVAKNAHEDLDSTVLFETNVLPYNLNLVDWLDIAIKENEKLDCTFKQLQKRALKSSPDPKHTYPAASIQERLEL